jgi:UDP:flavonoid glycosyltransferase YjiC (YdhE family)
MSNVLFVLEPLATGKAWRALAIAEQLAQLFPTAAPHFLAGPAAAQLLRAAGRFPVDDGLAPIVPDAATVAAAAGDATALARAAESAARRLAPRHALAALRAAKALDAKLVVIDSLFAAAPVVRRGGFDVAFLCDHLHDAPCSDGVARRAAAKLLRRAVVASTRLRFFVGEPGYLASPELRVWSRRWFRYAGPISGLARLRMSECSTLRDELGLERKRLLVVAAGGAFAARQLETMVLAADALAAERRDVVVKPFASPELALDDARAGAPAELCRWLAIADVALVGGGLSLLSECAGLRVPTLALPLPGHPLQARQVDWFAGRFGVRRLPPATRTREQEIAAIVDALRLLLTKGDAHRPHDAPDCEAQRRNAAFVADLLAEQMGRARPAVRGEA